MIYVVEIPHEGRPSAWFAFDEDDLARKVRSARETGEHTVFAALSPRQRLEANGLTPESPDARTRHPDVFDDADRHGWDTVLYRADYLLSPGIWQVEPVSELEACAAALAHERKTCRVYLSDNAAVAALYGDPLYNGREGFYAHMALREQLIAMEAMSDDL